MLIGVSCRTTSLENQFVEGVEQQVSAFVPEKNDFLVIEGEDVVVYRGEDQPQEVFRFFSEGALSVFWGAEREEIFVIQKGLKNETLPESAAPNFSVIRSFSLATGEWKREQVSRTEISSLRPSPQAHFLAYISGGDLYVLTRRTGMVQRIVENVYQFEWAPGVSDLLYTSEQEAGYVSLLKDGSIDTHVLFGDESETILALAFQNRRKVIGLTRVVNEDGEEFIGLGQFDLEDGAFTLFEEWRTIPPIEGIVDGVDQMNQIEVFDFVVSPSTSMIYVREFFTDTETTESTIYAFGSKTRIVFSPPGELLAWLQDNDMIFADSESETDFLTLILFSVKDGMETVFFSDAFKPAFSLSPYTL